MRSVHVRRHTLTKKGDGRGRGSHISAEGVDLARSVGSSIGPFDLVVGSEAVRTIETALAMGFAVDDAVAYPDVMDGTEIDFHAWWGWDQPFAEVARIASRNTKASKAAQGIAEVWVAVADRLADDGCALVVSHGGVMEVGLVGSLPGADHGSWGRPFLQCEGFELIYDGARFTGVTFFRL